MVRCKCVGCSRGYHGIHGDGPCDLLATGPDGFCKSCYVSFQAKRDVSEVAEGSATTARKFLDEARDAPVALNLERLRGLLQRQHPEAVALADRLLDLPDRTLSWEALSRDELDTLLGLAASQPLVRRLLRALPMPQLDGLVDPARADDGHDRRAAPGVRVLAIEHRYMRTEPEDGRALKDVDTLWRAATRSRKKRTRIEDDVRRATPDGFAALEAALRLEWRNGAGDETPPREPLLTALADKLAGIPIRQLVVVARLLSRAPSARWAASLKEAWLVLEDFSTRVDRSAFRYQDPGLWDSVSTIVDLACFSVADALARSAVAAGTLLDLQQDEARCQPVYALDARIQPIREAYLRLSESYNATVKGLQARGWSESSPVLSSLDGHLAQLRGQMETLEKQLVPLLAARELKWRETQQELSPAWLFLSVVRRTAHFADAAVQAALGGLFEYLRVGQMTVESTAEIRQSLVAVVSGDGARRLRERVIRVLPDSDRLELLQALQDGLAWMLAIGEFTRPADSVGVPPEPLPEAAGASVPDDYSSLGETVDVLLARIPGLIAFIERYPIRLMASTDLKGAFGVYRLGGADIELWYRYDRPQEHGGKVTERYLQLNDRTKPNSIGLDYRLLQHPLFCCPVLFHEMVHYGGLKSDPSRGVKNELYVLLCEIAFAKALLGRLAPQEAERIPEYERQLVDLCARTGYDGLLYQYLDDVESDSQLQIYNVVIPDIYRPRRDPYRAMFEQNMNIKLANMTLTWCAWVPWPELGTPESVHVTAAYLDALEQRWAQDHGLTVKRRNELIGSSQLRAYLAEWQRYADRPGALAVLNAARERFESAQRLDPADIGRLTAVRSSGLT